MKKIIVTADDYGMSQAINQAIEEGIKTGIITSTNVMTNMPFYKDMDKLAGTNASIGLHWNLTCGVPVSNRKQIPSLVREDGYFYSYSEFRNRYRKGKISNHEIEEELREQYNRYYELAGIPEYWNTHENVHVDFRIYKLFTKLAVQLGIERMRSHQRIYVKPKNGRGSYSKAWLIIEPLKSKLLDIWQHNASKMGLLSTDGRICCLNDDDLHDLQYTLSNIKWGKKEIGEIAIHPAVTHDSEFFGDMIENRIIEYQIATDPKNHELFAEAGIRLTNFSTCLG